MSLGTRRVIFLILNPTVLHTAQHIHHSRCALFVDCIMARGKFNKRGGGPRLDVQNAEEVEIRNNRLAELEEARTQRRRDALDDDDDEEGGEGDDGEEKSSSNANPTVTFEAAPPSSSAGGKGKGGSDPAADAGPVTTEADHKRNLAKLAAVRKRREEAEAKRKLEEEMIKQQEELERSKISAVIGEEDDKKKSKSNAAPKIPKIDKIAIKKMKPAQLKEALKDRGLEIQGTAKELQDRLLKYESER
jgi:SAP domain